MGEYEKKIKEIYTDTDFLGYGEIPEGLRKIDLYDNKIPKFYFSVYLNKKELDELSVKIDCKTEKDLMTFLRLPSFANAIDLPPDVLIKKVIPSLVEKFIGKVQKEISQKRI